MSTTDSSSSHEITVQKGSHPNLWSRLTEPSPEITNAAERRQVRLLRTMLLGSLITGFSIFVGIPLLMGSRNFSLPSIAIIVLMLIPYFLSGTKNYKIAAYILVLLSMASVIVPTLLSTANPRSSNGFAFLVMPILLASILLPRRGVLTIIGLNIAIILLMNFVQPPFTSVLFALVMVGAAAFLLMLFLTHRDGLEKDRQAELNAALKRAEIANAEIAQTNVEMDAKNKELARANALAKESARLKSEFLATMSHELRTPLNAIRGFTSIMLEGMGGEVDEEATHMITRVHANSDRLLNLINDILDIAKIEAGRMELVREPLPPRALVEQWRAQMGILADQKGLRFEVNVDPNLPEIVYGDSQRVTQIATNLLSNAFKFTKEGKVTLDVQQAADTWLIRVTDTGVGIPPHALNFVFEEFRQADSSSKREYGGTGLGLAIVRNLCLTMGGSVRVTSELGVGSVFTVVLPLNLDAEPQTAVVA
jgi:signal transduction histidine kinase